MVYLNARPRLGAVPTSTPEGMRTFVPIEVKLRWIAPVGDIQGAFAWVDSNGIGGAGARVLPPRGMTICGASGSVQAVVTTGELASGALASWANLYAYVPPVRRRPKGGPARLWVAIDTAVPARVDVYVVPSECASPTTTSVRLWTSTRTTTIRAEGEALPFPPGPEHNHYNQAVVALPVDQPLFVVYHWAAPVPPNVRVARAETFEFAGVGDRRPL